MPCNVTQAEIAAASTIGNSIGNSKEMPHFKGSAMQHMTEYSAPLAADPGGWTAASPLPGGGQGAAHGPTPWRRAENGQSGTGPGCHDLRVRSARTTGTAPAIASAVYHAAAAGGIIQDVTPYRNAKRAMRKQRSKRDKPQGSLVIRAASNRPGAPPPGGVPLAASTHDLCRSPGQPGKRAAGITIIQASNERQTSCRM
jgi:hypothetical protein